MSTDRVDAGRRVPEDCNEIIEIPMLAPPIKYEVDKLSGAIFVDRFMATAMHYPCNYSYIPRTLSADGDPVDVLVISPVPLLTGIVVRSRPIGLLAMRDEHGDDAKVLAVPVDALCDLYTKVRSINDLPRGQLDQIVHFFRHYKELEPGKFVEVGGWEDEAAAHREILAGISSFERGSSVAASAE